MGEDIRNWIKDHKTEIIIAFGVATFAVVTVAIVKNREAIEKGLEKLLGSGTGGADTGPVSGAGQVVRAANTVPKEAVSVEKVVYSVVKATKSADAANAETINISAEEMGEMIRKAESVGRHLRMLPKGQHASAAKLAEAAELDIDLKDLYTLVDGYERTRLVA